MAEPERTKPLVINDIPVLRYFFRRSTWRDMSVKWFLGMMLRPFFYRRLALSVKDAVINTYFGLLMGRYSRRHQPFVYLYIGANDGAIGDTIMPYATRFGWTGVLIEPVPHVMKQLKQNFKHLKNTFFEEVAVDTVSGKRELYTVRETTEQQPIFAQLIHSFSKEFLESCKLSWGVDMAKDIVPITVRTTTVANLLKKYKFKKVDLIVMDVESYDYTLLKSLDFDAIRPQFLKFEHYTMSEAEQADITKLLRGHGYKITRMRGDYFCRLSHAGS